MNLQVLVNTASEFVSNVPMWAIIIAAGIIIWEILATPYRYPQMTICIDIRDRRKPKTMNLIDEYLIAGGIDKIKKNERRVAVWKERSEKSAGRSIFKKLRTRQYAKALDREKTAYCFKFKRGFQTAWSYECSYAFLQGRDTQLARIGYSSTLNEYRAKKERNKMSQKLRQEIMERDGYKCQICGKRLPNGRNAEIDHIIPISKGGKTIPSNLQTLCFDCNRSKSDKLEYKPTRIDLFKRAFK